MTEQRRSQRYDVEWVCRYRLLRPSVWRPCRLIDVSDTGAAFEPFELALDGPDRSWEVAVTLPGRYAVSGAVRGAVTAIPGVVAVQDT